ncbi:MAG: methyltransferase domain-containing protein [Chloroflexi bacterium]|nr:methyltransferase domain-containing protein [Chloroflexota bacterium]
MTASDSKSKEGLATQRRYDRQAAFYDLIDLPVELAVFKRLRRRLWSDVRGALVLEIGVGTGKNVRHYPEGTRALAVDISPRMLRRAARRARRLHGNVDMVLADVQHLPFRDGAFDTAVGTFVFCSVPDPVSGLKEVRRVIQDAGRVHLLEHVRAGNPVIGSLMDLANPISVRLSGANINRDTVSNVAKADIALDSVESHGLGLLKLIRGSPRLACQARETATAVTGIDAKCGT